MTATPTRQMSSVGPLNRKDSVGRRALIGMTASERIAAEADVRQHPCNFNRRAGGRLSETGRASRRLRLTRGHHLGKYRHMAITLQNRAAFAEVESFEAAACLFHGFSDSSRIAILRHLAVGEHRVTDLVAHLGLAQSTVSKHLACLRDCGLVVSRPVGRASVYSLTHPEAMIDLFAAAERLLDLTGEAVSLCVNYGTETLPARL